MFSNFFHFLCLLLLSPGIISLFIFVILPFSISTLLLNEAARGLVSILLWIQFRGQVFLCGNGEDAMWDFQATGNRRMVLISVITKRGQLKAATCVKNLQDRLFGPENEDETYKKLTWCMTRAYGYVCWKKDTTFDLQNHLRTLNEGEYSEKDLHILLAQLTEDMPRERPQWEWIIVPKYIDSNGEMKSVLVFRFHHAYMDGMSLLMMLSKLSDNFNYTLNPLTFRIPLWKQLISYVNFIVFGTTATIQMGINKYRTHWVLKSKFPGEKKLFSWSRVVDMTLVRQIRSKTRATIPNIVSNAFVQACAHVLGHDRLPKDIRVGELIAFLPYPHSGPQNRFSAFSYSISSKTEGSISEKLQRTQADSLENLAGPQPLLFYYSFRLVGRLPAILYSLFFAGAQDSVYLSNAPCTKTPFSFFGADVEELGAFPPIFNETGIMLSSLSYNEGLKICGQADSSWLSAEELDEIFKEIPTAILKMADQEPIQFRSTANVQLPPPTLVPNSSATDSDLSNDSKSSFSSQSASPETSSSLDQNQNKNTTKTRRRRRPKKKNSSTART